MTTFTKRRFFITSIIHTTFGYQYFSLIKNVLVAWLAFPNLLVTAVSMPNHYLISLLFCRVQILHSAFTIFSTGVNPTSLSHSSALRLTVYNVFNIWLEPNHFTATMVVTIKLFLSDSGMGYGHIQYWPPVITILHRSFKIPFVYWLREWASSHLMVSQGIMRCFRCCDIYTMCVWYTTASYTACTAEQLQYGSSKNINSNKISHHWDPEWGTL